MISLILYLLSNKILILHLKNKGNLIVKKEEWDQYHFYIYSTNNFPTAAGLASSASGFACLVYTFSKLLNFKESFPGELTTLARLGSGSACRSLYGGFVKWNMGVKDDGSDSIGVQLADENHWDDIVILILVVSGKKKEVGSTSGMFHSVQTSELLKYRADVIVPRREKEFEIAIKEKDFQKFGELMMKDSNQFHSTCLDTYPPIFYLNDISKAIIQSITKYNDFHKKIVASYTFDAGPNAVIYTTKDQVDDLKRFLRYYFPIKSDNQSDDNLISNELKEFMKIDPFEDSIERIIETNIGCGPQVVTEDSHADIDALNKWKDQYLK